MFVILNFHVLAAYSAKRSFSHLTVLLTYQKTFFLNILHNKTPTFLLSRSITQPCMHCCKFTFCKRLKHQNKHVCSIWTVYRLHYYPFTKSTLTINNHTIPVVLSFLPNSNSQLCFYFWNTTMPRRNIEHVPSKIET